MKNGTLQPFKKSNVRVFFLLVQVNWVFLQTRNYRTTIYIVRVVEIIFCSNFLTAHFFSQEQWTEFLPLSSCHSLTAKRTAAHAFAIPVVDMLGGWSLLNSIWVQYFLWFCSRLVFIPCPSLVSCSLSYLSLLGALFQSCLYFLISMVLVIPELEVLTSTPWLLCTLANPDGGENTV